VTEKALPLSVLIVEELKDMGDPQPFVGLARVCAWCRKVFSNGTWQVGDPGNSLAITHGMCPSCFETVIRQIK
jgi:hypothetical protein